MSQVYWFKDGKQISKRSEHYRISRDADGTCSLHTVAASLDDDGNYTIMAGNPEVSKKKQKQKNRGNMIENSVRLFIKKHTLVRLQPEEGVE